jgi:hypothetical protein
MLHGFIRGHWSLRSALATSVLSLTCACAPTSCIGDDDIVFIDSFAVHDGPLMNETDTLHTYATDAIVPLTVISHSLFLDITTLNPVVDGAATLDPETEINRTGGVLKFSVRTGDETGGTVTLVDESGVEITTRELTVRAVDAIELSLPIADREGWTPPSLDVEAMRIFAGGKAALRTRLSRDGDEIHGLRSVAATTTNALVGTRQGIACAPHSCAAQRAASEIQVPETVTEPFDVVLTAGTASVTIGVVPTTVADITSFTLEEHASSETLEPYGEPTPTAVRAASLVDEEPVFGVPVTWAFDGAPYEARGDLAQYTPTGGTLHELSATLSPAFAASVSVDAREDDVSISSITAACSVGGGGSTPALFALALFVVRRRRSRGR